MGQNRSARMSSAFGATGGMRVKVGEGDDLSDVPTEEGVELVVRLVAPGRLTRTVRGTVMEPEATRRTFLKQGTATTASLLAAGAAQAEQGEKGPTRATRPTVATKWAAATTRGTGRAPAARSGARPTAGSSSRASGRRASPRSRSSRPTFRRGSRGR